MNEEIQKTREAAQQSVSESQNTGVSQSPNQEAVNGQTSVSPVSACTAQDPSASGCLLGKMGIETTRGRVGFVVAGLLLVVAIAFVLKKVSCKGKSKCNGHSNKRARKPDPYHKVVRNPNEPRTCVEIYVGNLSYDMTDDQLCAEFNRYGDVKSCRVIINRFTKKSKGFGFVEMFYRSEAEAAVRGLHDREVMGRKLRVNEAKNKSSHD